MNTSKVNKLLSLHGRGLITTPEFANALLIALVKQDGPVEELTAQSAHIPDEVRWKLRDLLDQIQRAGYHWRPFLIGPGGPILGSAMEDMARLQQICLQWGIPQVSA